MTAVGWALVVIGMTEPVMGYLLVGPRIRDERQRNMVTMSMATSGVLMIGLGIAFLTGLFEGSAPPA